MNQFDCHANCFVDICKSQEFLDTNILLLLFKIIIIIIIIITLKKCKDNTYKRDKEREILRFKKY